MTTGLSGINCSNGGDISKAIAARTTSAGIFSADMATEGRHSADSASVQCFISWLLLIVPARHASEQGQDSTRDAATAAGTGISILRRRNWRRSAYLFSGRTR